MIKTIYFAIIILTFFSCKTAFVPITESSKLNLQRVNNIEKAGNDKKNYFKSNGVEPFWGLTISNERIVLKTIGDSVVSPYVEPILAMDANVKLYRIKTEIAQLNIQISQQSCQNEMSGISFPYTVAVEYKKNTAPEFEKLKGCGQYITDYRLHDIWILEELGGVKINKKDFSKEFPLLEIYSKDNKFLGFAGCNRINGILFFENEKLQFTNIVITKMMCEPANKEIEFLKALQSVNTYLIENNKLILSNQSGIKIKFKKID